MFYIIQKLGINPDTILIDYSFPLLTVSGNNFDSYYDRRNH